MCFNTYDVIYDEQAVQQAWNKSRSCRCSDVPGSSLSRTLLCYLFIGDTFSLTSFYFGVYQTHRLTKDCEHGHMTPRANRKDGRNSRLLLLFLFPTSQFFAPPHVFSLCLPPSLRPSLADSLIKQGYFSPPLTRCDYTPPILR